MRKPSHASGEDKRIAIPIRKAAMYVRVAVDCQNSMKNQADAIREYASCNNVEIIETYTDSGKSGLTLKGRDGLKKLIDDVQAGNALFSMILLLDVTRWGRFQNMDESAHYERIFRHAGIDIQYVTTQFDNDSIPLSTLIKTIKRAMAGKRISTPRNLRKSITGQ